MIRVVLRRLYESTIVLLCAAGLATVDCGSNSSPTSPSGSSGFGSPVVTAHGSLSATLDGVRWDAKAILTVIHKNGSITITGSDVLIGNITSVDLSFPDSVGNHPVASAGLSFATVTTSNPIAGGPVNSWSSAVGGSNGTITVTSSTATGAAGTFQLNLPGFEKTPGTKVVTNGAFNVTY